MAENTNSQKVFVRILKIRAPIMAVITAMVRDPDAADDVFQDTMLELVKCEDRFDEDRDFLVWAKGVARNVVRRHWDKQARIPSPVEQELLLAAADAVDEEAEPQLWEQEKKFLRRCLEKLNEKYRRLFLLRYGENLKGPRLARKSGMKEISIRTILTRIRAMLRECINAQMQTEPAHE